MPTENIWNQFANSAKQNKKFGIKVILIIVVVELVIMAAGIGIWIVAHSLFRFAVYLIAYIQPVRQWFYTYIIPNQEFANQAMPAMNWKRRMRLMFSLSMNMILFAVGGWIIYRAGFLGQNLIYILMANSK